MRYREKLCKPGEGRQSPQQNRSSGCLTDSSDMSDDRTTTHTHCTYNMSLVVHLPKLHEDVHHPHVVGPREQGPCRGPGHELLIEELLPPRELAHHNVFDFTRQLLLHVFLEPSEEEGSHDAVQAGDEVVVDASVALHHVAQRVAEPI
jgi:hypothetical protein